MPAPSQPPYEAGALLQPRQLQRWLDVNKVNKLTRTQTYWTLSSFSVDCEWLGYSTIVAAFDFVATNNFSLPLDYDIPSNPNFCPCIMWVDEDYTVYRYRLWGNVGEVMWFSAPLYSGQLIKKNFRIEIWSVQPTGFTEVWLAGAGNSQANQQYEYSSATYWPRGGDGIGYYIARVGNIWGVFNGSDDGQYLMSGDNMPTGRWETVIGVDDPPPYGYINTTVSLAADATFYTSVAGSYDYMWQSDSSMATSSNVITTFSVPTNQVTQFDLPIVWPVESVPTLN